MPRTAFQAWLVALTAALVLSASSPAGAQGAESTATESTAAETTATQPTDMTTDFFIDPDFHGRWPRDPVWRPEHDQVLVLWNDGDGAAWWLFDSQGRRQVAARPRDLGASAADEVTRLAWSPDGTHLIFVRDGHIFLFEVGTRELRQLTDADSQDKIPAFSPDGKKIAFVRDDELHVLSVEDGTTTRLTHDAQPGVVFNGITDWVYWEEIWNREWVGFWWSPSGDRLAYYHVDDTEVGTYPLVDTSTLYPTVDHQRYPKAGETLPKIEVRVVELASGETVRLATGDETDAYLARVHWHPAGDRVAIEKINRDQTRIDLLLCGVDGAACRTLAVQEQPTWVNLGDEFSFLQDGRFLWSDESEGWRHLYLHEADGNGRRRLTPDGWCLVSLDTVQEDAGWVVFTAYSTGPLGAAERHVWRGFLDGRPAERLTADPGWTTAAVSDSDLWLSTHSTASSPPRLVIRDLTSPDLRIELPSAPAAYGPGTLPATEFLTIPGPDGTRLPAQLVRPAGFDPGQKYPVIMYHYGGPASQAVYDLWYESGRYLWHKWMALRGYAVFTVDNQASKFFGKAGEDRVHRRFGEIELAGQLAGVEYLKSQSWVDAGRIGLWGWSGGGSNTLYSLLHRPGVWKAGVAGAPVTDWRYYDAIWTERYFGLPRDNAEGYAVSSPITAAAELRDPLLLVHGTVDNNVHPQNTINLMRALIAADLPFEVAFLPDVRHSVGAGGAAAERHFFGRMTEFFDRHLR